MVRVFWPVFVLLPFVLEAVAVVKMDSGDNLVREKRVWLPPPKVLQENRDYSQETFVAKIHSDFDDHKGNIHYSLEGIGANKDPFHVFVVDPKTGFIRLTKILDREFIDTYNLSGVAKFINGTEAERKIDIRFKIGDENDNSPIFGAMQSGVVDELSPEGTSVMKVIATDADEPGTENSSIAYSILQQSPDHNMFFINADGTIYVKTPLDRETADRYTLIVKGQDLDGRPGGNSGTGTVTIKVRDVNDNAPTLEKDEYNGSIEENTEGVEVMRIKAEDLDLEGTENWEAVFDIVKGNEAGYFSITTDPETNEGILMLDKAVDYEDVKNLELGLSVRNKAPLIGPGTSGVAGIGFGGGGGGGGVGGGGGGGGGGTGAGAGGASGANGGGGGTSSWQSTTIYKTYPIKLNVKNQPEGPRFEPKVKAIPISEGGHSININDVIARYPAIDGDTGKPAENVHYARGSDPGNWLIIDPKTAEIKLNKMPDRESPHLVNGTYFAEIISIREAEPGRPAETATGTIALQVEDFNDHCPTLTSNIQTMCTTSNAVIVDAKDEDAFPNGPPFDFAIVPEGTMGKWQVEHFNDTAAILRAQESLWPGIYELELSVKDEQGVACPEPQKVRVQVCTCEDGLVCGLRGTNGQPTKGARFGPAGIGLLFLGLLLLALIPLLLLFCRCGGASGLPGGFTEMPFDTKSHLINYRTEGQGENTDMALLTMPTQGNGEMYKPTQTPTITQSHVSIDGMNRADFASIYRKGTWGMNQINGSGINSEFGSRHLAGGGGLYDSMALPDHFLRQYYSEKVTNGNNNLGVKDSLLEYDFEGQGSSAGSVGCCSLLESDNDLQFLDDLGPKFRTLAEVCGGKAIQTEVKPMSPPPVSAAINSQTSLRSLTLAPPPPPSPKLQSTISKTEQTVVRETSERSHSVNESATTMRGGIASQGQMLLVQQQQPVYYTTTPVLQPTHFVVQPQVQNTMLLAGAPATNLQGMVLVNSTQSGPAQGVVVQGQKMMSTGQSQGSSMLLLEGSGIHGDGNNLIHTGNPSGPQTMMIVDGKVPAGSLKVLKGSQTCLVQGGTLQSGGLPGSQRVLMVGGSATGGGQLLQEAGGVSEKREVSDPQRVLYRMGNTSTECQSSVMTSPSTLVSAASPTYHKVMQMTREIHQGLL